MAGKGKGSTSAIDEVDDSEAPEMQAAADFMADEEEKPLSDMVAADLEAEDEDEDSSDDAAAHADDDDDSQDTKTGQSALLQLVAAQQKQIEALTEAIKGSKGGSKKDEDDFGFDVGTIHDPENRGFEDLRPTLEASGKLLMTHVRAVEKEASKNRAMIEDLRDEIRAEFVKMQMEVSDQEEQAIFKWARGMGFSYDTPAKLKKVVKHYRDFVEKSGKKKAVARQKNANGNPPAEPITSTTRASEDAPLAAKKNGDPFQAQFDQAVKRTFKDLRVRS